jgi:hypothetical protein
MLRRLALTLYTLTIAALPALAQGHPISHRTAHPHDSVDHHPLDSTQHAALHALMHGTWTGTLTSPRGETGLNLSITHDSLHQLLFRMSTHQESKAGAGSHFALHGDTLHWNQELQGAICQARAKINVDSVHGPGAIHGTLACDTGDASFTLKRMGK